MRLTEKLRDRVVGAWVGATEGWAPIQLKLQEAREQAEIAIADAYDAKFQAEEAAALAELEIAIEDMSWRDLGGNPNRWNFNRDSIRKMTALSRVMYLINPLIRRAVTVQELYVWGSGCTLKASAKVQEVINDFFNDPKNQSVIGVAWPEREREQRIDGNTFFCFFVNRKTGTSRVRLIPVDQVQEIIYNPDDSKEPWFYKRNLGLDPDTGAGESGWVLYPDIDFYPTRESKRIDLGINSGIPIKWDARVYHIKTGGLSIMKFGLPELYSTLNWGTAYKKFLENYSTIHQAYARVAMYVSGLAGKKGVAAAKSKLQTGVQGDTRAIDNNPPTNTASLALLAGGAEMKPVRTANSTTGPDEARALRSMVAAGSDTPEHFFGDSDIGNFATSTTLDRPTELKMIARQQMWANVINKMCEFIITLSARAPQGKLRAGGFKVIETVDAFDGGTVFTVTPPAEEKLLVTVEFPPIIDRGVIERVRAVVQAATLGGSKAEGIIPNRKFLFKLLMVALGKKNADELTEEMYPKSVEQGFIDPEKELAIKKIQAEKGPVQPQSQ